MKKRKVFALILVVMNDPKPSPLFLAMWWSISVAKTANLPKKVHWKGVRIQNIQDISKHFCRVRGSKYLIEETRFCRKCVVGSRVIMESPVVLTPGSQVKPSLCFPGTFVLVRKMNIPKRLSSMCYEKVHSI